LRSDADSGGACGSAAGGRANAAATETATTDARIKAQAAYDRAQADLDSLAAAKPAAETQALIETTKAELSKLPATRTVAELEALIRNASQRGCHAGAALNGQTRASCPKYDVELARAWERKNLTSKIAELTSDIARAEQRRTDQRAKAQAAMDKASGELANIQPARIANSDAKALTRYLGALGLEVRPDRLNDLLVLLSVLVIEAGGGLSLAVGMALSGPANEPAMAPASAASMETGHSRTPPANAPDALPDPASGQARHSRPVVSAHPSELTAWLRLQGGRAETSMRRLANTLGRSPSGVHEELRRLVASGMITAASGPRGTVLALL
jgi:hypothetical protein